MARTTAEWIGKTDDTPIPDHVRLRVFDRHGERCYLCTRKILAGEYWECDHVIAIINGGPNRESNLKPACCNCCRPKTTNDVAEKSAVYQKRIRHLGIHKPKRQWPKRKMGQRHVSNTRQIHEDLSDG